jgi:phosphoenolpyruvate carboxykinase (GTP)
MPKYNEMTWTGLDFPMEKFDLLMSVTREGVLAEAADLKEYFTRFGDRLPKEIEKQRQALEERGKKAPEVWHLPD